MPISVECSCGKRLKAKDGAAGKTARCPACGKPVSFPAPEPQEYDPVADPLWNNPVEAEPPSLSLDLDEDNAPAFVTKSTHLPSASTPPALPKSTTVPVAQPQFMPPKGESEPWYYGFLDKYAKVWTWLGILLAGGIILQATFYYLAVIFRGMVNPLSGGRADEGIGILIVTTMFYVFFIVLVLGIVLVPVLFAVALIHVFVDIGRNIRATRKD